MAARQENNQQTVKTDKCKNSGKISLFQARAVLYLTLPSFTLPGAVQNIERSMLYFFYNCSHCSLLLLCYSISATSWALSSLCSHSQSFVFILSPWKRWHFKSIDRCYAAADIALRALTSIVIENNSVLCSFCSSSISKKQLENSVVPSARNETLLLLNLHTRFSRTSAHDFSSYLFTLWLNSHIPLCGVEAKLNWIALRTSIARKSVFNSWTLGSLQHLDIGKLFAIRDITAFVEREVADELNKSLWSNMTTNCFLQALHDEGYVFQK